MASSRPSFRATMRDRVIAFENRFIEALSGYDGDATRFAPADTSLTSLMTGSVGGESPASQGVTPGQRRIAIGMGVLLTLCILASCVGGFLIMRNALNRPVPAILIVITATPGPTATATATATASPTASTVTDTQPGADEDGNGDAGAYGDQHACGAADGGAQPRGADQGSRVERACGAGSRVRGARSCSGRTHLHGRGTGHYRRVVAGLLHPGWQDRLADIGLSPGRETR